MGGNNLNQYNGHSHGSYGFHYHLTIDSSGTPAFPYGPSLNFYGCGGSTGCKTSTCGSSTATSTFACSKATINGSPTSVPTAPAALPLSRSPVFSPSMNPSVTPTTAPSAGTTYAPTKFPSGNPSGVNILPTKQPTAILSSAPSCAPSKIPSYNPTLNVVSSSAPSSAPIYIPSINPTSIIGPTTHPTIIPSYVSSFALSKIPSIDPSSNISPRTLPTAAPSSSPSRAPTAVTNGIDYSCLHAASWQMNANNNNNSNLIFGSQTEILGGAISGSTWSITFNQIPYYYHNFTKSAIEALNSRPKASKDFLAGKTTAVVNQKYLFGSNIGYAGTQCKLGFWPPGPVCPAANRKTITFKLQPAPEVNAGNVHLAYSDRSDLV